MLWEFRNQTSREPIRIAKDIELIDGEIEKRSPRCDCRDGTEWLRTLQSKTFKTAERAHLQLHSVLKSNEVMKH